MIEQTADVPEMKTNTTSNVSYCSTVEVLPKIGAIDKGL